MPLTARGSCEDCHNSLQLWELLTILAWSGRGGCNPPSGFELLLDRHPDLATFPKSFEVWPLQEDLRQHWEHFLQYLHKTME